jgi:hypothetical protein
MTTSETPKKKGERKALPKAGKKKTYEQAVTSTMRRYAETLAKLAK